MGTGQRSQSLRRPRPSYGKLQEPWGRPSEGRLCRALSLRQGREKSRSSDGGPERPDTPGQERLPGSLGDTEQLIQAEQDSSQRWLRQYRQVWLRAGGWRGATGEWRDPKQWDPGEQRLRGRNGGATDQEDRQLSGQGLQREVFQRGVKVFGIYPGGTGESGKVLELMDDTVKAVLRRPVCQCVGWWILLEARDGSVQLLQGYMSPRKEDQDPLGGRCLLAPAFWEKGCLVKGLLSLGSTTPSWL